MKRKLPIAIMVSAIVSFSAVAAVKIVNIAENVTTNLEAAAFDSGEGSTVMVAAGGSTIILPEGSGSARLVFYPHLVVSGGVVRVKSSGWSRYRFVSGLRSVDGGSLEVEGVSEISVERRTLPGTLDVMPPTGPLCDIDNIRFASGAGKLLLRYMATVRRLPTTCPVEVLDGEGSDCTTIALACADANAAAPLLADGTLSLTNFNVTAVTATALPAWCKVQVSPGYTFMFDEGSLSEDGFSLTAVGAATGRFNIELLGRGAIVRFANTDGYNIRCESNVTGLGEILFRPKTGTVKTRFRGLTYQASNSSPISIPVDTANDPTPTEAWKAKVSHWFDASDADTIIPFTFDPSSWGGNWVNAKNEYDGHPIIIGWKDKVAGSSISLYNVRIWNKYDTGEMNTDYTLQVMPYLVEGGLNGKNYMCCGFRDETVAGVKYDKNGNLESATEGRRLRVWPSTEITGDSKASGNYTRFASAYCIMVFGSQQGGGNAVIGTDGGNVAGNGYLVRNNGISNKWTTREGYSMHADGITVNPNSATPNGGWQIVSIDMTATNTVVTGLGSKDFSDSGCGGQNYAEVIFFSEKPTAVERAACERYLAEKWGLEGSYVQWDVASASLSGNGGTVFLYDDVYPSREHAEEISAEGVFSGTMSIPAGTTLLFAKPLPPTEADVPETNRVGWYDPDFEGAALSTNELAHTDLLWTLYGRTLTGLCDGANDIMYASGGSSGATMAAASTKNFGPRMVTKNRSWLTTGGASRKWLEFKEAYSDRLGNTIRPKKVGGGALSGRVDLPPIKQAFLVIDTAGGGGSLISDDVNFGGAIKMRAGDDVTAPIWSADNTLAMSKTWLDTTEVDGATHGYSGRPEVLSFAAETSFKASFLAYYKGANTEVLGEFIFYSEPLGDEARTKVQEYLMYKWFGDLNGKYADYTGATVQGAGTVKSPTLRNLPKFSETFTGTVAGGSQLAFTVDSSINAAAATDAISLDRPLALEDGATVTIAVGSRLASGRYTLLTSPSISGAATLLMTGDAARFRNRTLTLHVDSGSIWLEARSPGLVVVIQ